jgi:uncharacterized protein YkwD
MFDRSKYRLLTTSNNWRQTTGSSLPVVAARMSLQLRAIWRQQPVRSCLLLFLAAFILQFCLTSISQAADRTFIYRTSNKTSASQRLGVTTVPAYAVIDGKRHPGLYIASSPTTELGRNMRLAPGMVLLTVEGYTMTSSQVADNWLASRTHSSQILFTYVTMQNGKPRISSGQAQAQSQDSSGDTQVGPPKTMSLRSKAESTEELESFDLGLINTARRAEGAAPVRRDSALSKLAQDYADYMAEHPGPYEISSGRSPHVDLQGRSPADRAREAGISMQVFENIGRGSRVGFSSDKAVLSTIHQQMMSEPRGVPNHRSTIMDPQSTCVGIGIARAPDRLYLAQEFAY